MSRTPSILVLDHKDSFVFILAEQFLKLGAEVRTYRSQQELGAWSRLVKATDPDLVVLSPGPGRPESAGVTLPWLESRPDVPILGICLGHQALAAATGGEVVRAPRPVHGRPWQVTLRDDPLFEGLPGSMTVARYHSLVVEPDRAEWSVTATAADGDQELIMAMRHRVLPWIGLQFHPESFLTPWGGVLVSRILDHAVLHRSVEGGAPA